MKFQKVIRQKDWAAPVLRPLPPTDARVRLAITTDPAFAAAVRGLAEKQ